MGAIKLVTKQYSVILRPFQDGEDRPRRELDIIPAVVYESPRSIRDERNLRVIWYSHPDPQEYNRWSFDHITISSRRREILSEALLLAEILAMDDEIQSQAFEMQLQALGFQRK